MSVEFEIRAASRRLGKFDDVITVWKSTQGFPVLTLSSEADYVWFFAPGISIRGLSLQYRRKFLLRSLIQLRLNVCASGGDWRMAASFMALALERGARVFSSDGIRIEPSQLLPTVIEERSRETFRRDLGLLQRILYASVEKRVTLPNQWFSLSLDPTNLAEGAVSSAQSEALHDFLASKTARYSGARRAALITLRTGATAILWSGEEMLAPRATFLVFPETRDNPDIDDYLFVSWEEALRLTAGVVEEIAGQVPAYYFPATDRDDLWSSLAELGQGIHKLET